MHGLAIAERDDAQVAPDFSDISPMFDASVHLNLGTKRLGKNRFAPTIANFRTP